jgi:ankyrin repeat protein
MSSCRHNVIEKIVAFEQHVSYDQVQETLGPLLLNPNGNPTDEENDSERRLTPLMVACDKGQFHTVHYLVDQCLSRRNLGRVIGIPLDRNSEEGNTAAHYAAVSGQISIWQQLVRLMMMTKRTMDEAEEKEKEGPLQLQETNTSYSHHHQCLLISARNKHGDTPLMMASMAGHKEFLREHSSLSMNDQPYNNNNFDVWKWRNESDDSVLSLACGYGHVDIVQLLLLQWGNSIAEWKDIQMGQMVLEKMQQVRQRRQQQQNSKTMIMNEQWEQKYEDVSRCVEWIRAALTQVADSMADSLLAQEIESDSTQRDIAGTSNITPSKKKKPKKKKKKKKNRGDGSENSIAMEPLEHSPVARAQGPDDVILTQLPNGIRAVVVPGYEDEQTPIGTTTASVTNVPSSSSALHDAQELLRSQFPVADSSSLCLNVSMLLWKPHAMALYLSASQLEAVDGILEQQRQAVQQARMLQARYRNNHHRHSSCSSTTTTTKGTNGDHDSP